MEDNINYAEKIENFKLLVENNNDDIAVKYLERVEWDERKAAVLYNKENRTFLNENKKKQNKNKDELDLSKFEECPIIFPTKTFISGIFDFFSYQYSNYEYVKEFKELKGFTSSYQNFINNLKNKIGLIFIYNDKSIEIMKRIIETIKNDALAKEIFSNNKTIFPIYKDCDIGIEMLKHIKIKKFPTMLVCKYKNQNAFSILGKTDNLTIDSIRETIFEVIALLNPQNKNTDIHTNNGTNISNHDYNYMSNGEVIAQQKRDLEELERRERERKEKEKKIMEEQKKIEEEKKKIEEEIKKKEEKSKIIKQNFPKEPDDSNPDKCMIVFRFPDGNKNVERKFLKNDKIQLLYDFIETLGRDIYTEKENYKFELIQTFPFKKYDNYNKTLEEEGLFPNSMLQIKEI